MTFQNVDPSEWRLDDQIGADRKRRLLTTQFEEILARIDSEIQGACCKKEPKDNFPSVCRALVTLTLPCDVIDQFHNGAGGYRAQYYLGIQEGERANSRVVNVVFEALKKKFTTPLHPDCDWDFVEKSLHHREAKAWIYEGSWLTDNRPEIRNLTVERWIQNAPKFTMKQRFEPIWAKLTPERESVLEIKGGWLGMPFGHSPKPSSYRSQEIHDFGYT